MPNLNDKRIVVTGAAGGLGSAIAERLVSDGARVVVSDIEEAAASEIVMRLGSRARLFPADVTNEADIERLVGYCVAEFGGLDAMVNNAGLADNPRVPIEERTGAGWDRIIAVNLNSAFYGVKHAARVMKQAGTGGVIVNLASVMGMVGFAAAPSYTAAKHGVIGLTKAAALELAPARIRVVCVAPGFIRTPIIAGYEDSAVALHPIGRLGAPPEVASMVAYLVSDEAGFLTGATYLVDGGYTAV